MTEMETKNENFTKMKKPLNPKKKMCTILPAWNYARCGLAGHFHAPSCRLAKYPCYRLLQHTVDAMPRLWKPCQTVRKKEAGHCFCMFSLWIGRCVSWRQFDVHEVVRQAIRTVKPNRKKQETNKGTSISVTRTHCPSRFECIKKLAIKVQQHPDPTKRGDNQDFYCVELHSLRAARKSLGKKKSNL